MGGENKEQEEGRMRPLEKVVLKKMFKTLRSHLSQKGSR